MNCTEFFYQNDFDLVVWILHISKWFKVCSNTQVLVHFKFAFVLYCLCTNRILGLCNNFAYVIMLSAAHDILKDQEDKDHHDNHNVSIIHFNTFYCKVLEKSEYYTSDYYTHIVLVLWSTIKSFLLVLLSQLMYKVIHFLKNTTTPPPSNGTYLECNEISTGVRM